MALPASSARVAAGIGGEWGCATWVAQAYRRLRLKSPRTAHISFVSKPSRACGTSSLPADIASLRRSARGCEQESATVAATKSSRLAPMLAAQQPWEVAGHDNQLGHEGGRVVAGHHLPEDEGRKRQGGGEQLLEGGEAALDDPGRSCRYSVAEPHPWERGRYESNLGEQALHVLLTQGPHARRQFRAKAPPDQVVRPGRRRGLQ